MGRRKWSAEKKMEIVLEGMAPGANISEVCRRHHIAQPQYYRWREAFLEGGRSRYPLSARKAAGRRAEGD
ncbi:transposase [Desmospora activa DSM 45169]|uniref:Transposase n=2 Tax=Desmospora TaxID=500614 RepID=A0A2T4Z0G4_9BACL|nr:transposase [Desmospora activa DSM 45169]